MLVKVFGSAVFGVEAPTISNTSDVKLYKDWLITGILNYKLKKYHP